MTHIKDTFRQEASEILAELETALLELENEPESKDLIERVFRALHTIKGNSNVVGFEDIGKFTHELESTFDLVRKGLVPFNKELGEVSFQARDQIQQMIDAHSGGTAVSEGEQDETLGHLRRLSESVAGAKKAEIKAALSVSGKEICSMMESLKTNPDEMTILAKAAEILKKMRDQGMMFGSDVGILLSRFARGMQVLHENHLRVVPSFPVLVQSVIELLPELIAGSEEDAESLLLDPKKLIEAVQKPMALIDSLNVIFNQANLPLSLLDEELPKAKRPVAIAEKPPERLFTYNIFFKPKAEFFQTGITIADMQQELATLGHLTVVHELPENPMEKPEKDRFWEILITTSVDLNGLKDQFIFVENCVDVSIRIVDQGKAFEGDQAGQKLGEILVSRGALSSEDLDRVLNQQKNSDEKIGARVDWSQVRSVRRKKSPKDREKRREAFSFMRVSLARLSDLVNLIGELVAQENRLRDQAQKVGNADLVFLSEDLGRLAEKLRDGAFKIRMEPIGMTFFKFEKMVANLARDLGKDIDFVTEGNEMELDKATIEMLNDPLVHLVRNMVDHGIEKPDVREKKGKPGKGTVRLAAEHSGGMVLIAISDDGAGLNEERILAKAIEKGLVPAVKKLSRSEIFKLIFLPGFSLASKVTSISGRGTGMDVVQTALDNLHATMTIDSHLDKGTTFTLKIPLKLAIVEGLLVFVGGQPFIFPLVCVQEIVKLTEEQRRRSEDRDLANVRGEMVPVVRLCEKFGMSEAQATAEHQLLVCSLEGKKVGFLVDQVIGEHQTLVKPLGGFYREVTIFSGATILGSGEVALILDLPQLIKSPEMPTISQFP